MITTENMLENAAVMFSRQWKELLELRGQVLNGWEHEDIHDLRVASRRFRALLDLLQPFFGWPDMAAVAREVKRLTKTLGELRNLDEARVFWGARLSGGEPSARFLVRLEELREQERKETARRLKRFSPKKLSPPVKAAASVIGRAKPRPAGMPLFPVYLANCSLERFNAVVSWLPAAVDFLRRTERHNLRISIKKWRYFLEILAGVSGEKHDDVLELLKKYQTLLGSMNDLAVFGCMGREMQIAGEETERILLDEEQALFGRFLVLAGSEPLRYVFRL